jgi:hypothetical protein
MFVSEMRAKRNRHCALRFYFLLTVQDSFGFNQGLELSCVYSGWVRGQSGIHQEGT